METTFARELQELDKIAFPKYHEKLKLSEDGDIQEVDKNNKKGELKTFEEKLIPNFRLEREAYQSMLRQYREGDVTYVQIDQVYDSTQRASNVILVGADFEEFKVKNLYKSLNVIKPDLVMMQVRPDLVLDKFKNYEDEVLIENRDQNYAQQITRQGFELYTNTKLVRYINKELKRGGVILPKSPMGQTEEAYENKVSQVKLYEDFTLGKHFTNTHRLTSEIIATTALWAE